MTVTVPGRVAMHPASTGKPGLKELITETTARTTRTSMKALSLYGFLLTCLLTLAMPCHITLTCLGTYSGHRARTEIAHCFSGTLQASHVGPRTV